MPHTIRLNSSSPEQILKFIRNTHKQLCKWLPDAPSRHTSFLDEKFSEIKFSIQDSISEFNYRHISNPPSFAFSSALLRDFGSLVENNSIEKFNESMRLFILHEVFHVRQDLNSYSAEGVGRFGFVLEAVDYDADAYAIDACLSYRNTQKPLRTITDLAEIIENVLSGINAFLQRGTSSEPLRSIPERRLRRLLIWNFQLARAQSFSSKDPTQFPLYSRVVIEMSGLQRTTDQQTSSEIDLTSLPQAAELAFYIDGKLFRIDQQKIVSKLFDSIRQDDRAGSLQAFEGVFSKHKELLRSRSTSFGGGLPSLPSEITYVQYFYGETTQECHQQIATRCKGQGSRPNFVSIVHNPEYKHPRTTEIGGQLASEDLVLRAFYALHPEYNKDQGWKSANMVREALNNLRPRYQFHHGPRLFGLPHTAARRHTTEYEGYVGPIAGVLGELERREGRHKAYAGLYNVDLDAQQSLEPMPALVGVQFIPYTQDRLDAVAFFRRLELSFWWSVNMLEMCELLKFVADRSHMKVGTISFLASVAEWKNDPEVSYQVALDSTNVSEMLRIVVLSLSGNVVNLKILRDMLEEKAKTISDVNLDASGLELLAATLSSSSLPQIKAESKRREKFRELERHIREAATRIKNAITDRNNVFENVERSRAALKLAIDILNSFHIDPQSRQKKQKQVAQKSPKRKL